MQQKLDEKGDEIERSPESQGKLNHRSLVLPVRLGVLIPVAVILATIIIQKANRRYQAEFLPEGRYHETTTVDRYDTLAMVSREYSEAIDHFIIKSQNLSVEGNAQPVIMLAHEASKKGLYYIDFLHKNYSKLLGRAEIGVLKSTDRLPQEHGESLSMQGKRKWIDHFIQESQRFKEALMALEERGYTIPNYLLDGGGHEGASRHSKDWIYWTIVKNCIAGVDRRIEVSESIRDRVLFPGRYNKLMLEYKAEAENPSPMRKLRFLEMARGDGGAADLEHRHWRNLYYVLNNAPSEEARILGNKLHDPVEGAPETQKIDRDTLALDLAQHSSRLDFGQLIMGDSPEDEIMRKQLTYLSKRLQAFASPEQKQHDLQTRLDLLKHLIEEGRFGKDKEFPISSIVQEVFLISVDQEYYDTTLFGAMPSTGEAILP